MADISALIEKLRLTTERIDEVNAALTSCEDDAAREQLTTELKNMQSAEGLTKTSLFEAATQSTLGNVGVQPTITSQLHTPLVSHDLSTSHDRQPIAIDRKTTRLTARLTAPKEYVYGENFTTWSSRIRRYFLTTNISPHDAIEILLNSVDDRTLEKLEPVADRFTDKQKQDIDTIITLFEQAMYPKSELRALRQKLAGGQMVQEEDEDVDTFASRIRSLAKQAYNEPADRHEPCLNTFLCGIRDVTLYDKVISVPGAEDSFELAVESARKFETMRRSTRNRSPEQLDVLRTYRVGSTQPQGTTESRDHSSSLEQRLPVIANVAHADAEQAPNRHNPNNNRYQPRFGYNNPLRGNNSYRGGNNYRGNRDNVRRDTRTCHLCGEQGHIVRFCPKLPAALNFVRAGNPNPGPSLQ